MRFEVQVVLPRPSLLSPHPFYDLLSAVWHAQQAQQQILQELLGAASTFRRIALSHLRHDESAERGNLQELQHAFEYVGGFGRIESSHACERARKHCSVQSAGNVARTGYACGQGNLCEHARRVRAIQFSMVAPHRQNPAIRNQAAGNFTRRVRRVCSN